MTRIRAKRATPRRRAAPRWTAEDWEHATPILLHRQGHRCARCGDALTDRIERHHRQRREVGGDRYANIVGLHPHCHAWVHAHPTEARASGLIVSSHAPDPAAVAVYLPGLTGWAWWYLDDKGGQRPVP